MFPQLKGEMVGGGGGGSSQQIKDQHILYIPLTTSNEFCVCIPRFKEYQSCYLGHMLVADCALYLS